MDPGGTGTVIQKIPKNLKLSLRGSVERQAQHRLDQLNKPRTGSVGTDRLGRTGCVNRHADRCVRKAGSMRKPGGHRKDIPRRNIFGSKCRGSLMRIKLRVSTYVSPYGLV